MTPSTGEVFRTFSNGLADTYWRMHKSSLEVGNIHALNNTSEHWYLNAVPGDLRFQTATTDRGMFNRVLVGQTIGSAMGLDLTGYFGVGAFSGGSFTRAASKVHIDRNGLNTGGYRAFMGEGLLATSGGGLLYAGMFGTAGTDLGLAWSSGSAPFRFVNTTAGGTSGREMGRFQPDGGVTQGFFGLGDWATAGLTPDERLHLLDKTIRLRNFMVPTPTGLLSYERVTLVNVLVADPVDGRVYWRTLPNSVWGGGGGGGSCDWTVTGGNNDVVTAYGGNPCPPQDVANVGIGVGAPSAKLHISKVVPSGGAFDVGVYVRMGTSSLNNLGGNTDVQIPGSGLNLGWRGTVRNASMNWGLDGGAALNNLVNNGSFSSVRVVGVRGFADGNGLLLASDIRGVWGIGIGSGSGFGYGGWFDGMVYSSGGYWGPPSDSTLKQNMAPLEEAATDLDQLSAITFDYLVNDFPSLHLDSSPQIGLKAQELEQVYPHLVRDVTQPAVIDSLGNEVTPAVSFKVINYVGLVPVLVAAHQDQGAKLVALEDQVDELASTVAQQQQQINNLLQQVSACCLLHDGTRSLQQDASGIGYIDNTQRASGSARDLRADELVVTPNPFTENPTISYRIGTAGRAQLRVSDARGQEMGVLFDTGCEAGQYSLVWNTEGMAAGLYLLTLTVDGARVTEQAVKVE